MPDTKLSVPSGFDIPELTDSLALSDYLTLNEPLITDSVEGEEDWIYLVMQNTQQQVIKFFDDLENRVDALNVDDEGTCTEDILIFRDFLSKMLGRFRSEVLDSCLSWEGKGDLVLISLLVKSEILDLIKRFEGLLKIVEKASAIKAESREALRSLQEVICKNENIKASFIGLKNMTDEELRTLKLAENTIKKRKERKSTREKRHEALISKCKQFLKCESDINSMWNSAENLVHFFQENHWLANGQEKEDLLTLRNMTSVFDLVVQLVERKAPMDSEFLYPLDEIDTEKEPDVFRNKNLWTILVILLALISGGYYLKKNNILHSGSTTVDLKEADIKPANVVFSEIPDDVNEEEFKNLITNNVSNFLSSFMSGKSTPTFSKEVLEGDLVAFSLSSQFQKQEVDCTVRVYDYQEMENSREIVKVERLNGRQQKMWKVSVSRVFTMEVEMNGAITDTVISQSLVDTWYLDEIN